MAIRTSKTQLSLTYNKFNGFSTTDSTVLKGYYIDDTPQLIYVEVETEIDSIFTITPNTAVNEEVVVSVDASTILAGLYNYKMRVFSDFLSEEIFIDVNLNIIDSDETPDVEREFQLKYYILRNRYRLDIYESVPIPSTLTPIEINGSVEINYQERKDVFEPIIASNLKLKLEADLNLTFSDLYSEEEKKYKTILTHDGETRFIGFLKPDGIIEDWVSDKWGLDIVAIDGLSTLKNLYFSNENGTMVLSKMSILDVIVICLNKTGLILPLNINVDIFYEGFDPINTIFESVKINTERFFKGESEPMDCASVLSSILNIFNATLIMQNGEWFISRNIDLEEEIRYSRFENGVYVGVTIYAPLKKIGSEINGTTEIDAFHVSENQRKSIEPSVQAYRIYYEYGGAKTIFSNPELKLEGSGLDIPGWTVYTAPDNKVYRNENGYGLRSTSWYFDINDVPPLLSFSQSIYINSGAIFNLSINFSNESKNPLSTYGLRFALGVGDHWLRDDGSWVVGSGATVYVDNSNGVVFNPPNSIFEGKGVANYSAQIKAPTSGNLSIIIYRDTSPFGNLSSGGDFRIFSIFLTGTAEGDIKGRVYTGKRTKNISTVTKSNNTVYNGDSVSDLFVGTLYKADFDTPTQYWFRGGKTEQKEVLEINAEDNLRLSPRPMIIMEGDLYNYVPYLSYLQISGFEGKKFQFKSYSYDFDSNIIRSVLKEYSNDYLATSDFNVEIRDNYGDINNAKI